MTIEYNVWADGTVICAEEYSYEEYSFMSDDYITIYVPNGEDAEDYIYEQLNSVNLGESCEQQNNLKSWLLS